MDITSAFLKNNNEQGDLRGPLFCYILIVKKWIVLILTVISFLAPAAAKNHQNHKPAKPAGITAKHVRPSWMTEKEINVSRRNPYTGKESRRYWTSPEVWSEAHQYRSTFLFTTDLGVHYSECPYYYNSEVGEFKGKAMPSFDLNLGYTFGGNLKNNFGIFIGCDYAYSHINKYYYENGPNSTGWLMDYRAGVILFRHLAAGFQVEYNSYFKQLEQKAYRVEPFQYGFYLMGMQRCGHHIGINASFSYTFNKQFNYYNEKYDPTLYRPSHPIMTDFAIHVGLVYYIESR